MKAEWHGREFFSEVAEVLGITTDAIMASSEPHEGRVTVLYSPDVEHEPSRIFGITLERDRDGVLQRASVPVEQVGLWEAVESGVEQSLREKLGPPPGEQ